MQTQRTNRDIRARQVVVIDTEGKNLGILYIKAALAKAKDQGLDLVEVNGTVRPPICKIMDYGKFQYDRKKASKNKPKPIQDKEVKITPQMDVGDLDVRLERAKKFLSKGHPLRLTCELKRGYQRKREQGDAAAAQFIESLEGFGEWDGQARKSKRGFSYLIKPC